MHPPHSAAALVFTLQRVSDYLVKGGLERESFSTAMRCCANVWSYIAWQKDMTEARYSFSRRETQKKNEPRVSLI
jgi:hypothetical protein